MINSQTAQGIDLDWKIPRYSHAGITQALDMTGVIFPSSSLNATLLNAKAETAIAWSDLKTCP